MRKWSELAFSTFLVVFFILAIILAQGWSFKVKLFPLGVAYPMLVIALINLALHIRTIQKDAKAETLRPAPVAAGDAASPTGAGVVAAGEKASSDDYRAAYMATRDELPPEVIARRVLMIILWMLSSFAMIWIIGLKFGIPIWMAIFLRYQSKEKIWVTLVLSLFAFIFMVGFFDRVVHIPWPDSQLTHWFGWDWTFVDGFYGFFLEYP